jgi:penicillin-insensitive murein DD-endopeptidase
MPGLRPRTVRYLGRIAVLVSLCLVGGVALGQDAELPSASSEPTTPEAPAEPTLPATTTEPSSETTALEEAPARRSRRTKSGSSRRSRRRGRSRSSSASSSTTTGAGSLSVGRHNRGRLLRGTELTGSAHVRLKHSGDQHHGTAEMVALLEHAADYVWSRVPGVRLTVGDISRHHGGRFRPHRSHQSGRDVDVGFYIFDDLGAAVEPARFFDFRADGTSAHDATWHFDDARNWALVEAFVTDTSAVVQYAFVSREIRRRLLDYGAAHGADPETLARAETVLWQPSRGGRHRDHFHVRIYCDPGDRPRCRDEAPYHPWTRGSSALAARAAAAAAGTDPEPELEADADGDGADVGDDVEIEVAPD